MTQAEYSAIVKEFLVKNFPLFVGNIQYKEDNSFDCSIQSPTGMVNLWIATYDREITVGFDDVNGQCNWHTHMSLFNAFEPEEELKAMSELLNGILSGREPIVHHPETGFSLTDNVEDDLKIRNTKVFYWTEL